MEVGLSQILFLFPPIIQEVFEKNKELFDYTTEIHFRIHQPIMILTDRREYVICEDGRIAHVRKVENDYICANREMIQHILSLATQHSLYAYETQLSRGFLSLPGGNRMGIFGEGICDEESGFQFRSITFLALRICHEIRGCGKGIVRRHLTGKGGGYYNTLLVSPPGGGKTTLLRDLLCDMSQDGAKVVLVDERGEIAACHQGEPQLHVGCRTSVITGCEKWMGMQMAVRSMSPDVVVADEVGSKEEWKAMEYAIQSGCSLLCTMHGNSIEDIKRRGLLGEGGLFQRIILLKRVDGNRLYEIYGEEGKLEWESRKE